MRPAIVEHLLALPIQTKILVANSLIIATGAVVGTSLMSVLEEQAELIGLLIFMVAGIAASVAINWVLVRLALRPLVTLARTAGQIRSGEPVQRFSPPVSADEDTRSLATALNDMLDRLTADAAALEQSRHGLRELASRTLGAQEDERRRIARELHDETAQVLATLLIQASLLRSQISGETPAGAESESVPTLAAPLTSGSASPATGSLMTPTPMLSVAHGDGATRGSSSATSRLDAIETLASAALESVRAIAYDLRPSLLDDLGLPAAIRWYAANRSQLAGLTVQVEAEAVRPAAETETALFRVAQEALTNVLRHAQAASARVKLSRQGAWIELCVEDEGRGFRVEDVLGDAKRERRLGLIGMQERVGLLGGELRVTSAPGQGTRVIARVPFSEQAPATPSPSLERLVQPGANQPQPGSLAGTTLRPADQARRHGWSNTPPGQEGMPSLGRLADQFTGNGREGSR